MTNRTPHSARGLLPLGLLAIAGVLLACSWSVTVSPQRPDRTVEALAEENAALSTQISRQATELSDLATRVSAPFATTPWMPEPTPPVYGYVDIEGGRCCVGGTAGSTVDVRVAFGAQSPFAEVTEMRARAGMRLFDQFELAEVPWEPVVSARIYPVPVPINWSGFYVSVQYRDALGNLSPVFSDDISVEGMPAPPTPTRLLPPGT